jgi:hypothetical protein
MLNCGVAPSTTRELYRPTRANQVLMREFLAWNPLGQDAQIPTDRAKENCPCEVEPATQDQRMQSENREEGRDAQN